jgi:AcrR family transcriptional regulator
VTQLTVRPAASGHTVSRRRGQALRKAIFDATLEQLQAVGYAKLTMEGIAAAAGTGKAALYRRWTGRDDLVTEALLDVLPDPTEILLTDNPRDDILALIRCLSETAALSQDAAFLVAKMEPGLDSGLTRLVKSRVMNPCGELLLQVLRRGIEAGQLKPSAANVRIANVGPAMIVHHVVTIGHEVPDEYVTSIVDDVIMPLIRL